MRYIEHYVPEKIHHLAPVHSPEMCTAVFLSKYKDISGPFACLSPCIAKSYEFNDPDTEGLIGYNVTYKKLLEHLQESGVDYKKSDSAEYDNEAHGLGSVHSTPGNIKKKTTSPFFANVLSCENGCNAGTRTGFFDFNDFDKNLKLSDFQRRYTPKKIIPIFVDSHELEAAFIAMRKPSSESRLTDCCVCGFSTCQKMAVAVAKGINHVDNCIVYRKDVLKEQREAAKEVCHA